MDRNGSTMRWAVGLMLTLGLSINIAVLAALASSHGSFVHKDAFQLVVESLRRIELKLDHLAR